MKAITNVLVYMPEHTFIPGTIVFDGGKITAIEKTWPDELDYKECEVIDGKGNYAIPGLVDIHFHGCIGEDLSDADYDGIKKMADYQASQGVTTICPASMTMSVEELHKIMQAVGSYNETSGAYFAGINMEGPFISRNNKGAQNGDNIIPCDAQLFRQLQKESGNSIRLVDIAPEEEGAIDFIDELKNEVVISIAHTKADYTESMNAFKHGATHVTHICNAMPPLNHRQPGVIGAAMDSNAEVEIICDGVHIHSSMIRALFRMFGQDKICMISDSMRATGLEDGEYMLGGQKVFVKGSLATLEDGTIAGSVTNLMKCMQNTVKNVGISLEKVIRCVTENPAKSIGVFDRKGSIEAGKDADIVLLNKELDIVNVFLRGEILDMSACREEVQHVSL